MSTSARPARWRRVRNRKENGTHQHFCLQRNFQQIPAPSTQPNVSRCISFMYDSDAFWTATPVLGLRGNEFVCEPFKSEVSVSYSPLTLPNVSPTVFQSQWLWGFSFLVHVPCTGGPKVGLRPHTLQGVLCGCDTPPAYESLCWCCGSRLDHISVPPTHHDVAFSVYP